MVDFYSKNRPNIGSAIIAEEGVMGPRTPTEMDRLVGQRIRLARKMAKLSQTQLGQVVGVTYQQIQKYENGTDRIGAGRLYGIAQSTDQPIGFFFSSAEADVDSRLSGDILADPKSPTRKELSGFSGL